MKKAKFTMKLLGKAVPSLSLDFFSITEEWVLGPEQFLTMPDLSFFGVSLSLFQTDCAHIYMCVYVCVCVYIYSIFYDDKVLNPHEIYSVILYAIQT